jgi:hypothetical protein
VFDSAIDNRKFNDTARMLQWAFFLIIIRAFFLKSDLFSCRLPAGSGDRKFQKFSRPHMCLTRRDSFICQSNRTPPPSNALRRAWASVTIVMELAEVWSGYIPVVFALAPEDNVTHEAPAPLYCMLPRCSYLAFSEPDVRSHFCENIPQVDDGIWFDFQRAPLKWHLPVGVLFDSVCSSQSRNSSSSSALPWAITVHFQKYPDAAMPRCRGIDALKACFFNTIRQSCWLRHGNAQRLARLSKEDHIRLFDSLRTSTS